MVVQGVSPLTNFKVGAEVRVKVVGYRALDANKLVSIVVVEALYTTLSVQRYTDGQKT